MSLWYPQQIDQFQVLICMSKEFNFRSFALEDRKEKNDARVELKMSLFVVREIFFALSKLIVLLL